MLSVKFSEDNHYDNRIEHCISNYIANKTFESTKLNEQYIISTFLQ